MRRRLSLAHEIAHLILNDCAGRELFYSGHSDSESEDLCNHVAGELLVPDWALRSYLNSNPVFEGWVSAINADTVLHAAAAFEVSVEVMAKRIFRDLKLAPNRIAVIWRYSGTENPLHLTRSCASRLRGIPRTARSSSPSTRLFPLPRLSFTLTKRVLGREVEKSLT